MRFRSYLLEWLVFMALCSIGHLLAVILSLYVFPIVVWVFSTRPLSWFSSDIVVKASLLGGGIGGIVGTLLYLVAIIDKRKRGLEPARQQWQWLRWQPDSQWARFSLMIACCGAIALFVLGMLCLGYVVFSHKPLSWPKLDDVIDIGLVVLALGIVFGTMIWWRPPRD